MSDTIARTYKSLFRGLSRTIPGGDPKAHGRTSSLRPVFELRDRDGLGRLGKFTTAHGTVETPALLPVINPSQSLIPPK